MGHTAPCRVGCRGEHLGRESAESCSGAPAPPRPARSALYRPLGNAYAAQTESPVPVLVRIQCNTSKHVQSKKGNSSRRNYGKFNQRTGPTRICDALHFWSPRLRKRNPQRAFHSELEAARSSHQSSVHYRHMPGDPIRGAGEHGERAKAESACRAGATGWHMGDEQGHAAQTAGTRAAPA